MSAGSEVARWEWRLGDNNDPGSTLEAFLAAHELPSRPLRRDFVPQSTEEDRFAQLFVSADGGAALAGGVCGKPTPVPEIPDIVAVVREGPSECAKTRRDTRDETDESPRKMHIQRGEWEGSWTHAEHVAAIESVKDAIRAGDVYQVNVVGHASAPFSGDPTPALHTIADMPGARYGGYLSGDGWAFATATPELLCAIHGDTISTKPIKGTTPYTPAGQHTLLTSAKERAEHIMIVDLERNDLARVAKVGTVEVPKLFTLREWCGLWHAESLVTAQLRDDIGLADVLRAICPGGSVTGAPKLSALTQIARLEPVGRGPAMGALGVLTSESLELGLTIRTIAAAGGRLHAWAGGGITIDSDPEAEVAEARAKAAPLMAAV